jgi:ATP-dependent DNA helicase Rep
VERDGRGRRDPRDPLQERGSRGRTRGHGNPHLHLRTNRPYSDFAILYRGNYQAKLIELKLQHHQVPYRLSGGNSFFGRQEVKDLMAYLRLLVNPDDDNAFLRVINVPRREIGSTTLEKLGNYATERGISMYAASEELGLGEHLDARYTERLQRFKHWHGRVRHKVPWKTRSPRCTR